MNANRAALLPELAARYGSREAIIQGRGASRQSISYEQFASRCAALAAGLRSRGLKPGDRVLLFVPMSIDLYLLLMACLHAGLCVAFVDAWADKKRLNQAVELVKPKAFIGSPTAQVLRLFSPAIRAIEHKLVVGGRFFPLKRFERPELAEASEIRAETDEALVTLTTGSTGKPKAAQRSHGFLTAQSDALNGQFAVTPGGIDMPSLPVFVLQNLGNGIGSVIPDFDPRRPAEINPEIIYSQIISEKVSFSTGSPAFFQTLAKWCKINGKTLPLKELYTGGAAVLPPLAKLLKETVEGKVFVVYGSTEAEPIAHLEASELLSSVNEEDGKAGGLCAGKPGGVTLKLIRPYDGPVILGEGGWAAWECASGEVGEVVVTGAHVGKGYMNDPEAELANKIKDGAEVWHRTGDAARMDSKGRLWLMGRVNARVRRQGETWWPMVAEARALQLSSVKFAAYLGRGDKALLCVECDSKVDEDELRKALAPYPVDEVRSFASIPRDPRHASKLNMEKLLPMLEAGK